MTKEQCQAATTGGLRKITPSTKRNIKKKKKEKTWSANTKYPSTVNTYNVATYTKYSSTVSTYNIHKNTQARLIRMARTKYSSTVNMYTQNTQSRLIRTAQQSGAVLLTKTQAA